MHGIEILTTLKLKLKILLYSYKAQHKLLVPTYLADFLQNYTPSRFLRSPDQNLLCILATPFKFSTIACWFLQMLLYAYKAQHKLLVPTYLADFLQNYTPSRFLRSPDQNP